MRTYAGEAMPPRSLAVIGADAIAMLRQDAAEYAFTGFLGGVAACFAALILRWTDAAATNAMIAPVTIIIAALTMSTATSAMCRATENLQPDAGSAFVSVLWGAAAFLRPWLALAIALFAAAYALQAFDADLPPWGRSAAVAVLVAGSMLWALRSSYHAVALVTQGGLSAKDADALGAALAWRSLAPLAAAWTVVLTPAAVAAIVALGAGFGPASTAICALVFVASMPVAAAMMLLLFIEAATRARAAVPRTAVQQRAERAARRV